MLIFFPAVSQTPNSSSSCLGKAVKLFLIWRGIGKVNRSKVAQAPTSNPSFLTRLSHLASLWHPSIVFAHLSDSWLFVKSKLFIWVSYCQNLIDLNEIDSLALLLFSLPHNSRACYTCNWPSQDIFSSPRYLKLTMAMAS